jgi:hypothetical protein
MVPKAINQITVLLQEKVLEQDTSAAQQRIS